MIVECERIILKYFSPAACVLAVEEMNHRKPADELELANVFSDMGMVVSITTDNETVHVTNVTGVFSGMEKIFIGGSAK